MKRIAILLAVLGCGPMTPEERGIPVRDEHKIYNQDKSMLFLEGLIEEAYGVSLDNVWQDTKVYWTDTECPYQDAKAIVIDGVCYNGIMWSCQEMYVSHKDSGKTWDTALLHEFTHCLSGIVQGYMDHDHSSAIWGVTELANQNARLRGW